MKYFYFSILSFGFILLISCGDRYYNDLLIINGTKDSLYYYIHPYKKGKSYTFNIAYNEIYNGENSKTKFRYEIDFSQNSYALKPSDSIRPGMFQRTWKAFSAQEGGITILVYKRKLLESISVNVPLDSTMIFKRIDLTKSQLDSLKYKIVIK